MTTPQTDAQANLWKRDLNVLQRDPQFQYVAPWLRNHPEYQLIPTPAIDAAREALSECYEMADEHAGHSEDCQAMAALVPCNCYLSRARKALALLEGKK